MSKFTTKQLIEHLREDSCQTCQAAADLLEQLGSGDHTPMYVRFMASGDPDDDPDAICSDCGKVRRECRAFQSELGYPVLPDPGDLPEELVDQVRRLIQEPTRNWQQGAEAAIRATIAYITKGTL